MFCPSCKAEIADGLKYCTQCGTALEANNTPSAQAGAAVRQTAQAQGVAPAAGQQAQQPTQAQQRPQQPVATSQQVVQPQFQQQPMQAKKQRPPRNDAPKKTGPVPFIALGISVVALILAIVGFVLPSGNQASNTSSGQNWRYAELSDSFSVEPGESTKIPAGYPTTSADLVIITGYGYDGMRFTHIVPGGDVNLTVPVSASEIGKLIVNANKDGMISNPTSQSITITKIYKIIIS